jgi:hypothetical protein
MREGTWVANMGIATHSFAGSGSLELLRSPWGPSSLVGQREDDVRLMSARKALTWENISA